MQSEQIIAVIALVLLVIVFVGTYALNKKTPVPDACKDILLSFEKCSSCSNSGCGMKDRIVKEEE